MIQTIALVVACCIQTATENPAPVQFGNWLPRLMGTMKDGESVDFEFNIDLHDQESTPTVSFSLIPTGDITMSLSVFDFSTSGSGAFSGNRSFGSMTMLSGDAYRASVGVASVGLMAAWDTMKPYQTSDAAALIFAPIAGLQWYGVDSRLENVTNDQVVINNNSWVSMQGGMRVQFNWVMQELTSMLDSISIESQFVAGMLFGGDGGTMWSVRTGVTLHVSQSVAGYFGYLLYEPHAENGSYVFDAGLQGLYLGGAFRF